MDLRKQYGEAFEKRHGIRLGFMSFYVKAVVEALKRYPEVNASIDGDDVGVPQLLRRQHGRIHLARSGHPGAALTSTLLGMADIEKEYQRAGSERPATAS